MKFKTPTGKTIGNSAETAGGVIVGAALSRGVTGLIPLDNKKYAQLLVGAGGALLAASVSGNDGLSKFARNSGIGMAAYQLLDVIGDAVKSNLPENDGSKITQFIHDVFGNTETPSVPESVAGALGMGSSYYEPEFLTGGTGNHTELEFAA